MKSIRQLLALLALLAFSTGLYAQSSKLSPDVQKLLNSPNPPANPRVIVQFKTGLTQTIGNLAQGLGGITNAVFNLLPIVSKTLPLQSILNLGNDPNVEYVTLDRLVGGTLADATDYSGVAVGSKLAAGYGLTGKGIGVAIIDSGISAHTDLASRVVYRETFVGGAKADDYGHGTHVAGIVAGNGAASKGAVRGVAPGVNLLDLRVLDAQGMSSDSVIIAAIERAVELKTKYNVRVINLSLGRPIFESYKADPLTKAVDAAWKKGIVVVVAAGNAGRNGYATILSPANAPSVITVGAMKTLDTASKSDDQIASYSSKGPTWGDLVSKPDVVAPGNLIVGLRTTGSKLDQEYPANVVDTTYVRLSGTSMAAPMVTGAAALMLERDPKLTPDVIKARLMKTASKSFPTASVTYDAGKAYPAAYDMFTVGAGYLDIPMALNNGDTGTGSAASPSVVYSPSVKQSMLFKPAKSLWDENTWSLTKVWGSLVLEPASSAWKTNPLSGATNSMSIYMADQGVLANTVNGLLSILLNSKPAPVTNSAAAWGSTAAWGSAAAWGSSAAWGSTAAWGSSASSGTAAAWGSTAAWGSAAAWGSTAAWGSAAAWGSTGPSGTAAAWGSTAPSGTAAAWGSTAAWGSAAAWGSNTNGLNEK